MTKLEAGESLVEIRSYIDKTYSRYAPPTDTELP
jgi:hypothetical protein